ncbi:MAG: enoyl-CoA hydratase-related protein [Alphaproteobacteria bacterium]
MILIDTHAGYRQITLNRPDRLNALQIEMAEAIIAALDDAQADETCRAVLLTGAGRGFCAGQDLTSIAGAAPDDVADLLDSYHPMIEKIRELPLPVVAAVNGVAAGAGCNLALACDIVIAARSASFVQAFARIGLIPDCGGTWFLPRLVGMARSRALMLLAEPLPAATAAEWGMIWRTVEDDRLMDEAHALTTRLAEGPTAALGLIKQALDESGDNDLAGQLDLEHDLQVEAAETPDHAEGLRAFLDKRAPVFTGRRD